MTIVVYEMRDSESGSVENENLEAGEVWNVTKKYLIGQCPDGMAQVKDEIGEYLPRYWQSAAGYWRRKSMSIKSIGKQCFEVTGEYTTLIPNLGGDGQQQQPEDTRQFVPGSIAWDTTGATEHISNALAERIIGGDGSDDFGGAINVQGTNVAGIDKVVPAMKYSETWIMPSSVGVSYDFVQAVYTATGTVNQNTFRAFSPGEALFLGARAQWSGDQPYVTVTFDFEARPNDDAYYVKALPTARKEGWEYPWVVYRTVDDGHGLLIQRPSVLIINQIYRKADWTPLRIVATSPGATRSGSLAAAAETAQQVNAFFNRGT